MDADIVASILGPIIILIGLLMLLVAAAGFLDWYGVIEVPWLNKDRKTTSDDTPPPTHGD